MNREGNTPFVFSADVLEISLKFLSFLSFLFFFYPKDLLSYLNKTFPFWNEQGEALSQPFVHFLNFMGFFTATRQQFR